MAPAPGPGCPDKELTAMTVKRADGTAIPGVGDVDMTLWAPDDPLFTMNEKAYREVPVPGGGASRRTLLWNTGDEMRQSEIDAAFTSSGPYPDTTS